MTNHCFEFWSYVILGSHHFSPFLSPISAAKFPKSALFTNRFRWNFAERFLGSKLSDYQHNLSYFVLLPVLWATSGSGLFFKYLVTQLINQSLGKLKLKPRTRLRFFLQVWGWGHLGVFGVIWGQNSNIFKPRQIIHQNKALGPVIKKKWSS